ncbi:MAG: hypothetical protein LBJ46_03605 [Planctomycetota bacterium]|jgi:hypothetical protein|nr:hypothetical protein [Planctomycetota bacterium]
MPEETAPEAASTPPASGNWFAGWKAWAVVIGSALLQAVFWIYLMHVREPGSAPDPVEQTRVFLEDTKILQSKVEIDNFAATVPGPAGDLRPLSFNAVLELHYLPEEKRPGAPRPTDAQIEVFRTVVVQLESKVRDHMNSFLAGQSFTNLVGDRGPDLVKSEMMRFVNNELERYDFERLNIPTTISRRRVTNVLLPSWTIM